MLVVAIVVLVVLVWVGIVWALARSPVERPVPPPDEVSERQLF